MGKENAALALDWLSLAPSSETPATPHFVSSTAAGNVAIPSGQRLGYAFQVPAPARFSADCAGDKTARLQLFATLDDLSEVELGAFAPGNIDVDLDPCRARSRA